MKTGWKTYYIVCLCDEKEICWFVVLLCLFWFLLCVWLFFVYFNTSSSITDYSNIVNIVTSLHTLNTFMFHIVTWFNAGLVNAHCTAHSHTQQNVYFTLWAFSSSDKRQVNSLCAHSALINSHLMAWQAKSKQMTRLPLAEPSRLCKFNANTRFQRLSDSSISLSGGDLCWVIEGYLWLLPQSEINWKRNTCMQTDKVVKCSIKSKPNPNGQRTVVCMS